MNLKLQLTKFFDDIYELDSSGIPCFKLSLGGKWVFPKEKKFIDIKSPIDDSIIARVSAAGDADADEAVLNAYNTKRTIRGVPAIERLNLMDRAAALLEEHKKELIDSIVINNGKTIADAKGEVSATKNRLLLSFEEARKIYGDYLPGDWAEENLGKYAMVIREPVGVVLAIPPFNYPLFITYTKIIPALLAGNPVIAKPASADPLPGILMAKIMEAAGVPAGALNFITGGGAIGSRMAESPMVNMVTFTGSTEVGEELTKISGIKKIHLELGGKGCAIILDDAELGVAAEKVLAGSLKNAGQRCDAINFVLVQEGVANKFVELLKEGIKGWILGDPTDEKSKVGPLIDSRAVARVTSFIDDAVKKGATLAYGGKANGNFVEPTLLLNVPLDATIMKEETFGPVVPVHVFKTVDEAIEIANRSKYGLDSSVFTTNINSAWKVAKRLEVGEITINNFPAHGIGFFPFGGVKESGLGREGIGYSIEEFTNMKTIVVDTRAAKTWNNEGQK
jgi:glyceraldehyde-3-phosphate dehydrogenase [NAD(P)+]